MSLEGYKIGTGKICSLTSIPPRSVPTSSRLLMPAKLGASKEKENVADKDVVYVNANTLLQRFK